MLAPTHLLLLSRVILLMGSMSLGLAAYRLTLKSISLGLSPQHFLWIFPLAAFFGIGKALLLMRPRMRANARRIVEHRGKLYIWQLYPAPLMLFIASMITLMAILKNHFALHPEMNAGLAAVDLAVALALLIGSFDQRPPKNQML
jgi:hypothetical protein